jgi:hypothetical protein
MTSGCMTSKVLDKAGYYNERRTTQPKEEEETMPGNPSYYALLSLSIPADIATSPFQLIGIMTYALIIQGH